MAKTKIHYECSSCGHTSPKWLGLCPSCNEWHTYTEIEQRNGTGRTGVNPEKEVVPLALSEVPESENRRQETRIGELDRALGGGMMPSSLILLGGDPGVGKSTLMLHIARANPDLKLLYIAGEESPGQIRQRAERIGIGNGDMKILESTDIDHIVATTRKEKPDLLIVDSIQTVYRNQLGSLPGTISQLKECAALLQQVAKREGVITWMIGHVTKQGDIAGPRVLEHMVDTVLQFEGDQREMYRLLRSRKNRFGPAGEVGVFEMDEGGLKEIQDPSSIFLNRPGSAVSGSVVTCVMEGSRPLLTEVQALVTPSGYGHPQRTAGGFDQRRLNLLVAVLEKRAGLPLSTQDIYLKITGGLKITDPAADLAVAAALVSSYRDEALDERSLLFGEVGLGGETRMIPHLSQRIAEGTRMGFSKIVTPAQTSKDSGKAGALAVKNIGEAFKNVFRS